MILVRRRVLQGLTLAGLAAGLGRTFRAIAGPISGTVIAVVNIATSKRPEGPAEPVGQGTVLEPGTQIATENKSAVLVQLADGSQFTAGARSTAIIGPEGDSAIQMGNGSFRFRSAAPGESGRVISTSALRITLKGTEILVSVRDNLTVCGVISGVITCTSLKKGFSVDVSAGQSVAWGGGSFGKGVTEGIATTGDPAADQGIEAADELWNPLPKPPAPKPEGLSPTEPAPPPPPK